MKTNRRHTGWWWMLALVVAVGTTAAACGEDGAEGPTGPTGPAGPAGEQGATGQPGADGQNGQDGLDGQDGVTPLGRLLDERMPNWCGDNRTRLNEMLSSLGVSSSTYDPKQRPVAVFDWDNTVLKNDIGDATMFWMINNDAILQPPARDWAATSANLTADAQAALNTACDAAGEPGEPLATSTVSACADEIFSIYDGGQTTGGLAAWSPAATTTFNAPYAWVAQLQAGHTPEEVRAMARAAFDQNNWAAIGATQTVGTNTGVTGYVRIYEQIRDLIGALEDNGFDVWVVTASPQFVVEAVSEEAGVPPSKVIGIRSVVENGKLTAHLQGCDSVADGDDTLITFYEGKRCWINKVIFHEPQDAQLPQNPDSAKRPVFAAGDSDTDIAMLKDATYLKLAINRNKTEIMCNALANAGDKWLVQPMFIAPKSIKTSPYTCSSAKGPDGQSIKDELGATIPDQTESACQ